VVTRNPTGNPIELSGIWTGRRIHVRIVVTLNKPTRIIGLDQKGKDKGWAALQPTQIHPPETRRRVESFMQRQTGMRNGVTLCSSQS
jgi:hypothetical protein